MARLSLALFVLRVPLWVGFLQGHQKGNQVKKTPIFKPFQAYGRGSTPMGSHFGVGEFTTRFRTYFSGDWDVHWGRDFGFDPWSYW